MAITYPTTLDTLTNPAAGDAMNVVPHATQHADANDAVEALEAKVGVNGSTVVTSHDYIIKHLAGVDVASFATAGTGTSGSPWTGWYAAITWASDTTYYFRPGYFASSVRMTFDNLKRTNLIGAGHDTILKYTGAGATECVRLWSDHDFGVDLALVPINNRVESMTIESTGNGTDGLSIENHHHVIVRNVHVRNVTTAGFRTKGCVVGEMTSCRVWDPDCDVVTPTNGFVFDESSITGSAVQTTVFQINNCYVQGVSGIGFHCKSCFGLTFMAGASETNGQNLKVEAASFENNFHGFGLEITQTTDIEVDGDRNTFINCNGQGSDITFTGDDNRLIGGWFADITSNGNRTVIDGTQYNNYVTASTDTTPTIRSFHLTSTGDIFPYSRFITRVADGVALSVESAVNASNGHAWLTLKAKAGTAGTFHIIHLGGGIMGWGDAVGDTVVVGENNKKLIMGVNGLSSGILTLAAGKIGVQQTAPTFTLDVAGTARVTTALTVNDSQVSTGDVTFKGQTDASLLVSDASADRIGIGTATPKTKLDVNGRVTAAGYVGSFPKGWWLAQEPGQPSGAETPNESRVAMIGISVPTLTCNGTTSQCVTDDTGQYIEYTTATAGSSEAGWEYPTAAPTTPIMAIRLNPVTRAVIKTGTAITEQRVMIGWFGSDPMGADTSNSIHAMGFRWSVTTANNPSVSTGGTYTGVATLTPSGHTATVAPAYTAVMGVRSVTLTAGGSAYVNGTYTNQPMTGGGGTGATFEFTVSSNVVQTVTFTSAGEGYTSAPALDFSAAGGSGATGTTDLKVVAVESSNGGGSNVTVAPTTLTPSGGGQTVAATFGAITLGGQLQCFCGNGTAWVFDDPRTAIAADTRYVLSIDCSTVGTVVFSVNDVPKATINSNLPGNTTSLAYYCNLRITSTNARSLRISSMKVDQE